MPAIEKLSPDIIGKIAAGEVVERPASVVKELVENAIDAQATNVTVELRGGGIEYIRISDNGKGIPAEQMRLAFERHATSKLRTAEQLFNVETLGFRGEALASVAAVAKVSCTSKTADAVFGVRCVVEGGEFTDIRQAASPVGTTFIVEDLFFNTPVRRKFLKKPAMEAAAVSDYMLRLILSHPEIAFRFVSQGKTVYHSMGDGKLESALFSIYGKEALSGMIAVEGHMNGVLVKGYIGVGENARGNRQQQSFFVNGRYFRNEALSRALEGGCEGRVMIGKFPMCALFLTMPYHSVDVNVHPNKLEVRFQDEAAVGEAVRTLTAEAMQAESLGQRLTGAGERGQAAKADGAANAGGFTVVALDPEESEAPETMTDVSPDAPTDAPADRVAPVETNKAQADTAQPTLNVAVNAPLSPVILPPMSAAPSMMNAPASSVAVARAMLEEHTLPVSQQKAPAVQPIAPTGQAAEAAHTTPDRAYTQTASPAPTIPSAAPVPPPQPEPEQMVLLPQEDNLQPPRLVGIVFDTYWIFEAGEKLLLIDQHAAHERLLYDRLMKRFDGEQVSQQLLSPQLVPLNPHDMALAEELSEVLHDAGFEVERFDDRCVALHGIPTLFGADADPKSLFLEALDEWQMGRGQLTRERMRRQVAQMACKHAIKGGDRLNQQEIQGFLNELLKSDAMPTCPHGRPIVTEITRYALEKQFKRIQ